VWNHGGILATKLGPRIKCNYCPEDYDPAATTSFGKHLNAVHGRSESNPDGKIKTWGPMASFLATRKVPMKYSPEAFRQALVDFIVVSDSPFSMVECPEFRSLLSMLKPGKLNGLY
jgi:hypothetical protein